MAERFTSEDDYNPLGEHVVEIPARDHGGHGPRRRSFATIGVAVCLALAGIVIAVGAIGDQARRSNDEEAQREELRDGWQILGALAADGAARDGTAAAAPAPSPGVEHSAPAAPPSVVIVTVPAQAAQGAQPALAGAPAPVSAPQTTSNSAGPINAAMPAFPGGIVAAPASVQSMPNTAALNGAVPNGTLPAPNALATPAATQAPLTGAVPASNATEPLPSGNVPASPPTTLPASHACGVTTCAPDSVCCNPSCGICAAPGATCSQQSCG